MKTRLVRLVVLAAWLLGVCLPASASVSYDTCTWTGAVSDDWNTAANWSCGHVPSPNDACFIPPTGRQPRIYTSATIGSLTLNSGGQLAFAAGSALTLNDDLVLNSQSTLKPSSGTTITLNGGDWTNNGGGVDAGPNAWTAIFNLPGNQTINGTATTQTFYNVGVNNQSMSSATLLVGGSTTTLNVSGTLTLGQDTTFNPGTATNLNVGGNWINNGGSLEGGA